MSIKRVLSPGTPDHEELRLETRALDDGGVEITPEDSMTEQQDDDFCEHGYLRTECEDCTAVRCKCGGLPMRGVPGLCSSCDMKGKQQAAKEALTVRAEWVRAADVEVKPLSWLWPARLLRQSVVLVEGRPEEGKSTVLVDLAARISSGQPMPGERMPQPARDVVVLAAEDDIETTIVPRLIAAGADLSRIHLLKRTIIDGVPVPFSMGDDIQVLRSKVIEVKAAFVIVDPLVSYLGSRTRKMVDTNNDMQVRKALMPLADLASQTGACVAAIRHYRKGRGTDAVEAGGGSIAFTAFSRVALACLADPREGKGPNDRLLAVAKNNLVARERRPALEYRLVPGERDPSVARVAWGSVVDLSAGEILTSHEEERTTTTGDRCGTWLEAYLSGRGPVPSAEVKRAAEAASFKDWTIKKAARDLGVIVASRADVKGRQTTWALPGEEHKGTSADLPFETSEDADRGISQPTTQPTQST